ncbi:MAG TPA: patatin-like phospholipase family protein [Casimicrobiaceae bacterium]|nr:patatin-like phospholipase family protein [Casimicrobiaceae bacterium]
MNLRTHSLFVLVVALLLAGCATRPVNPPLAKFEPSPPLLIRPGQTAEQSKNLIILAFSGGGTRAAAFSYGVLEALRRIEVVGPQGRTFRLLDQVDAITGISGGSFTALAYGLYGDKLFDIYESAFLKRDVQGALMQQALNPFNWASLASNGWGRSELAANFYDEILFHGATFDDIFKRNGPLINVSATDISTGSKVAFNRINFDIMCAQLGAFRLARAAAASSAVPVVLSSVTINNYGGTCGFKMPQWTELFLTSANPPRPAARAIKRLQEMEAFQDGKDRPYIHLVDGGISDNLGLRGVLDILEALEAVQALGVPTPLDHVDRIIVFIVNSLSIPNNDWDKSENGPGMIETLIKATGVPIDKYSGEAVEQLKDIEARWAILQYLNKVGTFPPGPDPMLQYVRHVPHAKIFPIDVSFPALKDPAEREYLNQLPTSFVLADEQVDRLRAAAARIIQDSPDMQRILKDTGARIVEGPVKTGK